MSLAIPSLEALSLSGRRVLVRVDFNVPFEQGPEGGRRISDDTRVRAALPTVRAILDAGGTPVLLSHLGRPRAADPSLSLAPVADCLAGHLGAQVRHIAASRGAEVERALASLPEAGVVLLENVRFNAGETAGDPALAAEYARLGAAFVNDAFGSSHRDHASVTGLARLLPSAAGLLLQAEIEAFARVLETPERPFAAVLGGAKVSDKLPVILHLLERVEHVLVGGGMAYTFLAAQGHSTGDSMVEPEQLELVRDTLAEAERRSVQIHLPLDHVAADRFGEDAPAQVVDSAEIPAGLMALDIGPRTQAAFASVLSGASTVVWNGPMGVFEWESFRAGTEAVGRAVAACDGYSVVGGGDSVAAIELLGLGERIDHISTGGGASLELLKGVVLPGIAALDPRPLGERGG